MEYKVIRRFKDKNDKSQRVYEIGDQYEGSKAAKRLSELMNPEKNSYNQIYLEKIDENGAG